MFKVIKNALSVMFSIVFVIFTMASPDKAGTEVITNPSATNQFIVQNGDFEISAHRSGAGLAPQNTLMAFEYCVNSTDFDLDYFEFDVQLTKDNELIMLHDGTYDTTSNAEEAFGKKNVAPSDYTFEALQVLNLGENFKIDDTYPYRGLRGNDIPENLKVRKVSDILDYILKNEKHPYKFSIEIKSNFEEGKKAADELYHILSERNLLDKTIVSTYHQTVLKYIDEKYPDFIRAAGIGEILKFYYYARTNGDFSKLNASYEVLQLPYGKNVMPWRKEIINLGTREVINYAHKNNIAVQYWTVNDIENVEYLVGNGADCVMTDHPDMVSNYKITK